MPYFYLFVVLGLKQFGIASPSSWPLFLPSLPPGIGQTAVCRPEGEAEPHRSEYVDGPVQQRRWTESMLEEEASQERGVERLEVNIEPGASRGR